MKIPSHITVQHNEAGELKNMTHFVLVVIVSGKHW